MIYRVYTDGGSRPHNNVGNAGGWGVWIEGDDVPYGLYGSGGVPCTNNMAEMMAYLNAVRQVVLRQPDEVCFYLDSRYVMDNCGHVLEGWKKKGWLTSKGEPVKNIGLWKAIDEAQQDLRAMCIPVEYKWVKGHSGIYGNECADSLATAGIERACKGIDYGEVVETKEHFYVDPKAPAVKVETVLATDGKKAPKVKIPASNAFICFSRLLDISHRPQAQTADGRTVYMAQNFTTRAKSGDDDGAATKAKKAEGKTRNLGTIDPDASEGVVVSKTPCMQYQRLRDFQNEIAPLTADYPFIVAWDTFTSKARWEEHCQLDTPPFKKVNKSVFYKDKTTQLTYYLEVPRLAYNAVESCMSKLQMIEAFEQGKFDGDIEDITDMFFTTDKKGKSVLKKTADVDKVILHETVYEDKPLVVRLTQKIHIPEMTAISRMFKQEGELKIYFVKFIKTPVSFRHGIIIVGKDNIGFYNSPTSSLRLVP